MRLFASRLLRALPVLTALALGCVAGPGVRLTPGPPLTVQTAAVFPFHFRWDEPSWRSYELSARMVGQLMATGRFTVFGPGEFRVLRAASDNPFAGTDLALGLAERGLEPTQALVFRPSAERRVQSGFQEIRDAQGRPGGSQRTEESTLVGRLEVFFSASGERIAEVSGSVVIDPLLPRDATDPLPELTALMDRLMAAALDALEVRAPGVRLRRQPGFEWLWSPVAAFEFAADGKPSLLQTLERLDALDQEVLLDGRLRFFHPTVDERTLARLKRTPGGLLVTGVSDRLNGTLQSGDLVVSVQGEPALPQVLFRALRSAAPDAALRLRVRRHGELVDVELPAQP